jgi:hypothetical protein
LTYEPNYYDFDSSRGGPDGKDFEYIKTISKVVTVKATVNGTTSGSIDFSDAYLASIAPADGTLTISFRAANSDSLNYYHKSLGYGKINFNFNGNTIDISDGLQCSGTMTNGNCSGTVYSLSIPLTIPSPTNYSWSAYIDNRVKISLGFMEISAVFTYEEAAYHANTMMMAGGLRIKSILDYAAAGTIARTRTYDYGYHQDRNNNGSLEAYSYGKTHGLCLLRTTRDR